MKQKIFFLSLVAVFGFGLSTAWAEFDPLGGLGGGGSGGPSGQTNVSDLDALTNEVPEEPVNSNVDANANTNANTNTNEPSEIEITLAECIIYQKLEIEDARCDRLMAELNCPDYAAYLNFCEQQSQYCLADLAAQKPSVTYSGCVASYNSCIDLAVDTNSACAKQFPPRQLNGEKTTQFGLTDATGDVRVFYEDNPTPARMQAVDSNRTVQTGAAIFTGDNGTVTLTLPNGITQVIGPNTYFRLVDYYTGQELDQIYTMLKNGNVRIGIDRPNERRVGYIIITPLWKVSAKGTEFDVSVEEDGTEKVSVVSGTVEVTDVTGSEVLTIPAGQVVTYDPTGKIISTTDNNPQEDEEIGENTFVFTPDPWYTNVWGWVGAGVVLLVLIGLVVGVVGLVKLLRKRK